MGEATATTKASLTELRASLDLLHGRVAVIDTTQQSLVAQLGLIAGAVQEGAKIHADAARQLAALGNRLGLTSQAMERLRVRSPSQEEDDSYPADCVVVGKGTLRPTHVGWTGNTTGASSAAAATDLGADREVSPLGEVTITRGDGIMGGGGHGGAGGGRHGGADGGGHGGAGGGRQHYGGDGDQPRIWKDKCLDYFRLFNVHPSLWLVSSTLHMDGNAALWLKAYRLRHEVNSWPVLMTAVEEKFGADDHRKFMKQMLALKQRGTVEEYQAQFEELSYQIAIQNPNYDEQFYVSQFIRGLKSEIRAVVES